MSQRWRDAFTFDYYDLSNDGAAWDFTALDDDDMIALRRAGFRPLGVSRAVLRSNARRKLTNQIWVSADGRVSADGGELATLFEDGTIVKTNHLPPSAFIEPAYWKVRSHGKDRHPYTFVDGPLSETLAAHLEQVARFDKESPVVVFSSMTQHFAVRLRDAELRIARQRPEEWIVVLTTVTLGMASMCTAIVAWGMRLPGPRPHNHPKEIIPGVTLGALAFIIVAMAVFKVTSTWIAPLLVRLRPGPPPRPAATWIERAREVPAGTLEGT